MAGVSNKAVFQHSKAGLATAGRKTQHISPIYELVSRGSLKTGWQGKDGQGPA